MDETCNLLLFWYWSNSRYLLKLSMCWVTPNKVVGVAFCCPSSLCIQVVLKCEEAHCLSVTHNQLILTFTIHKMQRNPEIFQACIVNKLIYSKGECGLKRPATYTVLMYLKLNTMRCKKPKRRRTEGNCRVSDESLRVHHCRWYLS